MALPDSNSKEIEKKLQERLGEQSKEVKLSSEDAEEPREREV